jgi:hypothetical protein
MFNKKSDHYFLFCDLPLGRWQNSDLKPFSARKTAWPFVRTQSSSENTSRTRVRTRSVAENTAKSSFECIFQRKCLANRYVKEINNEAKI